MSRLLVLACSERKLFAEGDLPAIERYDGPAFRVLRKYLLGGPSDAPRVLILSARYGLIPAETEIPYYDCRLTPGSARALRPAAVAVMRQVLGARRWDSIGVCLTSAYRAALEGFRVYVPGATAVQELVGNRGTRLTRLLEWLKRGVRRGR